MNSYDLIIYLFIFLIFVYVVVTFKSMKVIDITFIIIGIMVLILNYVSASDVSVLTKVPEHFTNSQDSLGTIIQLEEDISNIPEICVMYFTSFNNSSYSSTQGSTIWKSLIDPDNKKPVLTFSKKPSFSPKDGFDLSSGATIKGPNCDTLAIKLQEPYTIMMVCKHKNLLPATALTNVISILQLYAFSGAISTNGLHLYIEEDIQTDNNVQLGKLKFKYSDGDILDCRTDNTDPYINLPVNVLTFYFINIADGTLTIKTMSEVNNEPITIASGSITPNEEYKFINQALDINTNGNWKAQLYNFAIFNGELSNNEITTTYDHVMNEYKKRNDPSYIAAINAYNSNIENLSTITSCPFNNLTCDACQSVDEWYNMNSVVNSAPTCKNAINRYCTGNPNTDWCKCWNSKGSYYNTAGCQSFRSLFAGKTEVFDSLTEQDLAILKDQYKLVTTDDCKLATNNAVQNVWQETRKIVQPASTRVSIPSNPEYNSSVVNYYTEGTDKNGGLTPQLLTSSPVSDRISASFQPEDTQAYQEYLKMQKKNGATNKSEALQTESYFNKFLQVIMPA